VTDVSERASRLDSVLAIAEVALLIDALCRSFSFRRFKALAESDPDCCVYLNR
jgi:hypothetical protein